MQNIRATINEELPRMGIFVHPFREGELAAGQEKPAWAVAPSGARNGHLNQMFTVEAELSP